MTREEEIMKEVEDCFEYFDKDGYDEEFLSTTSAEKITDLIINHEQDTLKEFVEWLDKQNCIYSFLDGCYLVFNGKVLLNEFLKEKK